ncbi:uncharacterized protein K02A2.6-like, partial [Myzus persicae]|uniref:uncharacterized protein K02A2.6-like n=1 Tax=Myzus persicae TaxID=13164 RepID=UPI000B92FF8A
MEMFQVEVKSENNCGLSPVMIMVKVENTLIEMEVDSGAGISILPEEVVKEKLPHIHINPTILKLRTYDGSIIKPIGEIEVKLMYGERELYGKLLVVKKGHRALVGRDLMNKLGITIRGISKIEVESTNKNDKLELLINEFEELFEEKIVEDELDRLEREEIIQKVETSEWGTPLVPVIKPDGSIRLCTDYKTTVNKYLVDINHPLPRVEEVFVALQGGKTFSKLDFLNAYNQLELCESTQKLLAWSTSKGIYIVKRLPFGTKPACSKFQSVIEKVLLGTKGVKNFLDDIIVAGSSEQEHLDNLGEVFKRHIIGSEGIERDKNKVKAMLNAVEPKSVTEVKAFTGMVNYYAKFIPNLSTLLGPIYNLLKKEVKRIQRWALYLSEFDYQVLHVKGRDNKVADGLSRLPDKYDVQTQTNETDYVDFMENTMPIDYEILRVETKKDKEILIPKILRKNLLKEVHSTHMDKDIENWVQSCDACLQSRSEPILAEPKKWEEASCPMDRVHIDFLYLQGKDYLIMTDVFTKWPEVAEMKVSNSGSVIEKLREIFARFGLPNKIVSDNGPQFRSEEFIQFCKNNMIRFVTSSSPPYHPATNGSAENAVKSLKNSILKAVKDKTNKNVSLNTLIQRYLLTYRNTPHWITGESPSYRMFGSKIKTRLDRLCIPKETNKYVKRFRKVYFKEGDIVYARDYSNPNKKEWKKGTIEEVLAQFKYESGRCYQQFVKKAESSFISNPKSFWDFVRKNKNGNNLPSTVNLNGVSSTNNVDASELFSKHFSSVFSSTKICTVNALPNGLPYDLPSCCYVDIDDVESGLSKLRSVKSIGPDGLPGFFLYHI